MRYKNLYIVRLTHEDAHGKIIENGTALARITPFGNTAVYVPGSNAKYILTDFTNVNAGYYKSNWRNQGMNEQHRVSGENISITKGRPYTKEFPGDRSWGTIRRAKNQLLTKKFEIA